MYYCHFLMQALFETQNIEIKDAMQIYAQENCKRFNLLTHSVKLINLHKASLSNDFWVILKRNYNCKLVIQLLFR